MASTAIAEGEQQRLARPLKVLVPLIKEDLELAHEAERRASMPHYRSAGEKLLEAKSQLKHNEFIPWIRRNFSLSYETARRYMRLVETEKTTAVVFSSLSEALRVDMPNFNLRIDKPEWHEPVKSTLRRVDTDTLNRARDDLKRAEEREAQRKLALQLIDIGYKVLARTLHPDKGGSREAMARLNAVRARLKQQA